jgi:hypothetical protein
VWETRHPSMQDSATAALLDAQSYLNHNMPLCTRWSSCLDRQQVQNFIGSLEPTAPSCTPTCHKVLRQLCRCFRHLLLAMVLQR